MLLQRVEDLLQVGGGSPCVFVLQLRGLGRVAGLGELAMIQIRRKGEVVDSGKAVGDGFRLIVEPPPFLDDDQRGPWA